MAGAALLLAFALSSSGASAPDVFAAANARYQAGDFAGAEGLYRALVEGGVESGAVYYNLGNACFKQRKLGEAVYFWERARRRLPQDPELRDNLALANLLAVDRIEVPEDPLPVRLVSAAARWLTLEQEGAVALGLWSAATVLRGLRALVPSPRARTALAGSSAAAAALLVLVAASMAWKYYDARHRREGVVVAEKVDIRSGPGPANPVVFTIHEGIVVRVRAEASGWYQVTLPNGWTGWAAKGEVREL